MDNTQISKSEIGESTIPKIENPKKKTKKKSLKIVSENTKKKSPQRSRKKNEETNNKNPKNNTENIKIQSWWRGCNIRRKFITLDDGMSFQLLNKCIDSYIITIKNERIINKNLKKKKIRLSNFPSHISENIAKFAIFKKYGIMPNWDTDKGDLLIDKTTNIKRCEVKGSIDLSNGPPTFGPTEEWDYIYFVDGVDNHIKKYKVYEIKLSNKSETWKNIKVNKTETYFDQCIQKRRPRITFKELKKQLGDKCKLIFDGHVSELDNAL